MHSNVVTGGKSPGKSSTMLGGWSPFLPRRTPLRAMRDLPAQRSAGRDEEMILRLPEISSGSFALPSGPRTVAPPIAGASRVDITPQALEGIWTLRVGRFGCRDDETRGGVVVVDQGRLMGGDDVLAYSGRWALDGSELSATLNIVRHAPDRSLPTLFGIGEEGYRAHCIAELISPDLIEGRLRREGHPDARLTMRRLSVPG